MDGIGRLPLNALRVLDSVARHGSMAGAADELSIEPSAVSMQIRRLSQFLGTSLVTKSGRGVELTPAAAGLIASVSDALRQIEHALERSRQEYGSRPFKISLLPSILLLWIMPRYTKLERIAEGRSLVLFPDKSLAGRVRWDVDAAIRLGKGEWPGTVARKLMNEWLVPVCAPEIASTVGWLEDGRAPHGHRVFSSRIDPWPDQHAEALPHANRVLLDDAVAVVSAAERGWGVSLARWSLVEEAVLTGRLVQSGAPIPYKYAYYWVCPEHGSSDPLSDSIYQWLITEIRTEPLRQRT